MGKFQELTGQRFGRLTAVKPVGMGKWLWRCDCGNEKEILVASVKRGKTLSCGTSCKYSASRKVKHNLTGQRFGRLVVIQRAENEQGSNGARCTYWKCICDCGKNATVSASHLQTGHTQSCGCAHQEQMDAWKTVKLSHGRSKNGKIEKSYQTWMQIKRRCYNQNDVDYKWYGKKGIDLWNEWLNDAGAFCNYVELLDGYNDSKTTIDRIDVSKGYIPGNLRWISLGEQQRNKTNNVLITYNGETRCAQEWADMVGMSRSGIIGRLKRGWTIEDALTIPPRKGRCGVEKTSD